MTRTPRQPLAITMGDPAGIGGDVTLKAWVRRERVAVPPFVVIDDPARLSALARRLGLDVPLEVSDDPCMAFDVFHRALPVVPLNLPAPAVAGSPDPANGSAVVESIERAVSLVRLGTASAVVTNPINKKVLRDGGFAHPGHTEFLAELAGRIFGAEGLTPVMMLACEGLRVVPVTIHLALRQAVDALTTEAIVTCGEITAHALETTFARFDARIAVAALNPHAGEGGEMGREEIDIIAPAVEILRAKGIDAVGPLPADTLFHAEARMHYDAVLCMYHDQALIPLKTIDFHGGVNVTLGLPFVRTSPDHGTAYGIAGTGKADESSFLAACRMAADMAVRRAQHG